MLLEVARNRRTIQDFSTDPVDEALVERALRAAHAAPCHKLTWPWRFTRVGRETRSKLFPVALRLKSKRGPLAPELAAKLERKILDPHALVVVTQVLADDAFRREEDYAATACAIQNAMLVLAEAGVGSKWSTGGLTRDPETFALLGIDPAVERSVGFLWIGHAAREHKPPARPPLRDVLRSVP